MKKLFAVLAVAGLAFVACGPSAEEIAAEEKRVQDSIAAEEQRVQDSIALAEAEAARIAAEEAAAVAAAEAEAAQNAAKKATAKKSNAPATGTIEAVEKATTAADRRAALRAGKQVD